MKRSPLKRPTLAQVVAWQPKPRRRIRARGKKALRTAGDERAFRSALQHRSMGYCEATERVANLADFRVVHTVCGTGILHAGTDPHHLWPEDRRRGLHDPERGVWLCRRAHEWVHANPRRARELGLLRPDPEDAA